MSFIHNNLCYFIKNTIIDTLTIRKRCISSIIILNKEDKIYVEKLLYDIFKCHLMHYTVII